MRRLYGHPREGHYEGDKALRLGWSLMGAVGLVTFGAILDVVYRPVYAGDPRKPSSLCISNLRNLTFALLMYAGDADEHAPTQNWSVALGPYHGPRYETCPRMPNGV